MLDLAYIMLVWHHWFGGSGENINLDIISYSSYEFDKTGVDCRIILYLPRFYPNTTRENWCKY